MGETATVSQIRTRKSRSDRQMSGLAVVETRFHFGAGWP